MSTSSSGTARDKRQAKFRSSSVGAKNAKTGLQKEKSSSGMSSTDSFEVPNSDRDARKMRYYIQLIERMEEQEQQKQHHPQQRRPSTSSTLGSVPECHTSGNVDGPATSFSSSKKESSKDPHKVRIANLKLL